MSRVTAVETQRAVVRVTYETSSRSLVSRMAGIHEGSLSSINDFRNGSRSVPNPDRRHLWRCGGSSGQGVKTSSLPSIIIGEFRPDSARTSVGPDHLPAPARTSRQPADGPRRALDVGQTDHRSPAVSAIAASPQGAVSNEGHGICECDKRKLSGPGSDPAANGETGPFMSSAGERLAVPRRFAHAGSTRNRKVWIDDLTLP